MQAAGTGFLAIWSDVFAHDETDYLHWLTREHTEERVGVPGFRGVRVFRARTPDICRYFILYRLDNPAVIGSVLYLERLNAPSTWSQRIMPILKNFVRGGGTILAERRQGRGAAVLPVMVRSADLSLITETVEFITRVDRIVAVSILEVDQSGTLIPTAEKSIRSDERSFDALLLIEGLDQASLCDALSVLQNATKIISHDALLYDQIYSLDQSEIQAIAV